jgi:hypothetical protein
MPLTADERDELIDEAVRSIMDIVAALQGVADATNLSDDTWEKITDIFQECVLNCLEEPEEEDLFEVIEI